jgi:hypothetical protein
MSDQIEPIAKLYVLTIRLTSMLTIVSSRAVLMHLQEHLRFQVGSIRRKACYPDLVKSLWVAS